LAFSIKWNPEKPNENQVDSISTSLTNSDEIYEDLFEDEEDFVDTTDWEEEFETSDTHLELGQIED
jgi:hypothetical protein